jgi:SAM-dependent methyltransferase
MSLNATLKNWNRLGEREALWAILNNKDKKEPWNEVEFFKTGVSEIDSALSYIESLKIPLVRNRALDFGCGVGRLTQALAKYFKNASGVDGATSMITLANTYNQQFGNKVKFFLNDKDNLQVFSDSSFDFIYSNITLQHMEPKFSKGYIREFARLLAPGGVLLFQLTAERKHYQNHTSPIGFIKKLMPTFVQEWYRKIRFGTDGFIDMYGVTKGEVVTILENSGLTVKKIRENNAAGDGWTGFDYCAIRPLI